MSAPRKRWRLRLIPSFTYESARSQKQAYERVARLMEAYAAGSGRTHHVVVEVDERDGFGWRRFESIAFPPRKEELDS